MRARREERALRALRGGVLDPQDAGEPREDGDGVPEGLRPGGQPLHRGDRQPGQGLRGGDSQGRPRGEGRDRPHTDRGTPRKKPLKSLQSVL